MKINSKNKLLILKIIFIYNAILSGWTVSYKNNNKFEFKKNKRYINKKKEIDIKKFIEFNLNINNLNK